jgi:transposase
MATNKKTKRHYDSAFKESVLSMLKNGQSVSELSKSLGIGESLIYKWRSDSLSPGVSCLNSVESAMISENSDLRKQVKQLEQERDILKKALLIFSRPT